MNRGLKRRGTGHQHSGRGAAAVEFALVSPVLALIVFGVLQYGLYFHDTLVANEAVRTAARSAVVETGTAHCAGSFDWSVVQCATKDLLERDGAAVRVSAPAGWAKGDPLTVCVQFPSQGDFGFLPMPNGGYVHAELQMSIEQTQRIPSGTGLSDPAPDGQDWSWC